jgi:outer membrane receptor protein involved in Fe transport
LLLQTVSARWRTIFLGSTAGFILLSPLAAAQDQAPSSPAAEPQQQPAQAPMQQQPGEQEPGAADAQVVVESEEQPETVIVFGRAQLQIGIAEAASEGAVGGADLSVRPILRTAELLEAVPGLIAVAHSGSGKANQYFLRGMNLDHGTDFTAFIDDVPWNFRTHGHGQGYLDINGLIPETIVQVDYRKGPYRGDLGDFALAGAALITTTDGYDRPFAQAEVGSFGWYRALTGGTFQLARGALTLVGQYKTSNGPWELPENLQHWSGFAKYSRLASFGELQLSLSGYTATWRGTEQIPERAIGHVFSEPGVPTIDCRDEFCAVDPTQNGLTARWIANARILGTTWRANVYTQFYNWHMSSNPTLYLSDPVNGDQILQQDRRWIYGGRVEKFFVFNDMFQLRVGAEGRYDDISAVGVAHSVANVILDQISLHAVQEGSAAAYAELTWAPIDSLRFTAGARGDAYSFDVKALDPNSLSGSADASTVSPKFGVAWRPTNYLELYGNWGQGFHSNDGRGVAVGDPPVPGLVKGTGKEVGGRVQVGDFNLTATYWWLENDSELIFVGDSNSVEPKGASERRGYEFVLFWRPFEWLAIDAVYAGTHARFKDSPGQDYIPNAPDAAGELGVAAIFDEYEASMRVRYHGAFPLVEDNSQREDGHAEVNFRFAWKPGPWVLSAELLNAFDEHGKDIVYLYTSRLPGEPLGGVDGLLGRASEPRQVRVALKHQF